MPDLCSTLSNLKPNIVLLQETYHIRLNIPIPNYFFFGTPKTRGPFTHGVATYIHESLIRYNPKPNILANGQALALHLTLP